MTNTPSHEPEQKQNSTWETIELIGEIDIRLEKVGAAHAAYKAATTPETRWTTRIELAKRVIEAQSYIKSRLHTEIQKGNFENCRIIAGIRWDDDTRILMPKLSIHTLIQESTEGVSDRDEISRISRSFIEAIADNILELAI